MSGHLIYGAERFELADTAAARASIEAALDSNSRFVDVNTTQGSLRIYLNNGVQAAVLDPDKAVPLG